MATTEVDEIVDRVTFGEWLQHRLNTLELSRSEATQRMGGLISYSGFRTWMTGYSVPDADKLPTLARVLDVTRREMTVAAIRATGITWVTLDDPAGHVDEINADRLDDVLHDLRRTHPDDYQRLVDLAERITGD